MSVDPRVQALYTETASLVGIDEPRSKIIKWLIEEDEGARRLKVVSIVGSGGMGKTTLANQVYMKCKQQFHCTAFIPVSQNPNLVKIFMHILSEVGYDPRFYDSDCSDERKLINILRKYLKNKRYLIVIDDLWSAEAWNIIKCSFVDNDCGSRVTTTTRIQSVANACCSGLHGHVYMINPLNDLNARELFHRRIFISEDVFPDQLREIRDEIIKKCRGVPLAILSVASILASHEEGKLNETWDKVHSSLAIQLETNPALEWMRHVLSLSYGDLSPDLKTCMLYLCIFPEDYIIMKEDLIKRWVAEGFLCDKYGRGQGEVAESYFNELINRSMVQIAGIDDCGDVTSCRVHDLMLDFITSKSTEENFISVINDQYNFTKGSFEVRRLSVRFKSSVCDHALTNMALTRARSFNFWGPVQRMCSLSKFQLLRVLSLDFHASKDYHCDMSNICNLFLLRYLRTKGVQCKKLLPQLQKLQHLQTLEIFDDGLGTLQLDVRKLSSGLWHLNIPANVELIGGIGRMRALRTLATLRLTVRDAECIKEIGDLSNLRDLRLELVQLDVKKEKFVQFREENFNFDLLISSLCKLDTCNLQSLTICVGHSWRQLRDMLACWSPPPLRIHRLHILACPFSVVPEWIASLNRLRSLEIEVIALSKSGIEVLARLASLLHLRLHVEDHVPEGGVVICSTTFPNLREFWFRHKVPSLTFEAGAMPKLQSMSIECYAYAHGVEQDDDILAGIENLGSVKVFKMQVYRWNNFNRIMACRIIEPNAETLQKFEMQNLMAALRRAVSKHPGSPDIIVETVS